MRYTKTILMILLIGFIVLLSGCGKKEKAETLIEQKAREIAETEKPEPVQKEEVEEVKTVEVIPEKPLDTGAKVFTVQVLSLTDRYAVELQQEMMLKKGVRTVISEFVKDGETYYRLRLDGKYSRHGAEEAGEQVKRDFWGINEYWIVKTG
ncbi:MAG: hypothetical protein K9M99_11385 [Candidatus Cloacimonetes bacterium]|nr:hypothetical protein [Candidatus Cloacimonadota bacterium]